jgi:hypothetical protein
MRWWTPAERNNQNLAKEFRVGCYQDTIAQARILNETAALPYWLLHLLMLFGISGAEWVELPIPIFLFVVLKA